MRVLIVAPTYLPSRRANTLQVMKMAQAMKTLCHDVCVLVPKPGPNRIADWDDLAQHYGLRNEFKVEWLQVNPLFRGYDFGFKVLRYFRAWKGEILYTRLPQAAALASFMGIFTIFEVHDLPGGIMGPFLLQRFLEGKGAKGLILITKALRKAMDNRIAGLPDPPFTMITPDGVDLDRYENIQEPKAARRFLQQDQLPQLLIDQFTVGYTGHFYPGRGIDQILEIASNIPDMTFLLIGGNIKDQAEYQEKADAQSLDNIFFTGFINNTDLPKYQAACDVLLMPYQERIEASSGGDIANFLSPMKMFEYLACGRVIISSDLPVIREVLHDSNAILLPPDEIKEWVRSLREIEVDPERQLRLAARAREDAKQYSWEERAALILSLVGTI